MPGEQNPLLTFKEAMAYLRVSRSTLYRLITSRRLDAYKIGDGSDWRFYRSDLQAQLVAYQPKECKREPRQRPQPREQSDPPLSWSEERMARTVAMLVESEQPASDEERERLRAEWIEQGEDAVLEAARYLRRRIKRQRAQEAS